jgi:hypothetical protein
MRWENLKDDKGFIEGPFLIGLLAIVLTMGAGTTQGARALLDKSDTDRAAVVDKARDYVNKRLDYADKIEEFNKDAAEKIRAQAKESVQKLDELDSVDKSQLTTEIDTRTNRFLTMYLDKWQNGQNNSWRRPGETWVLNTLGQTLTHRAGPQEQAFVDAILPNQSHVKGTSKQGYLTMAIMRVRNIYQGSKGKFDKNGKPLDLALYHSALNQVRDVYLDKTQPTSKAFAALLRKTEDQFGLVKLEPDPRDEWVVWSGTPHGIGVRITTRSQYEEDEEARSYSGGGITPGVKAEKALILEGFSSQKEAEKAICAKYLPNVHYGTSWGWFTRTGSEVTFLGNFDCQDLD